jgi:1-acyl-sn-glycerol-3-phosphate acyltransferase
MAGREQRKKTARKRSKARRPAPKPVLGNDPFERGAAVRSAPIAVPSPSPSPSPSPTSTAPSTATRAASVLRERLVALEQRVDSAAASATAAAGRLGDLARQEASGEHARELLQLVAGLLPALRERLAGLASLRALLSGGDLDAFGMDRELVARAAPVLDFLYTSWWRVEPREIDHVPATGPVVLVANHGGALAWDALVLQVALRRDHPAHRDLRPLLDDHALGMPVAGGITARLGAVPATPENALRLLGDGAAVAVFPEGSRSGTRPWPQRYRVERFGRGGFAKLAVRTGAVIVPCAIVGSEETSAPFARAGWLSDRLGLPFPLSAPALPFAPLGLLPLPSRWSIRFGEPLDTRAAGPGAAEDPARVLELTERTRASLQQMLDEDVAARRSVYL